MKYLMLKIRQLFCWHDFRAKYQWYKGSYILIQVCTKCGKVII